MAQKIPTVKMVAWESIIPQAIIFIGIFLILKTAGVKQPVIYGGFIYLGFSQSLRRIISRYHILGVSLIRQTKYNEAIVQFNNSYNYFNKHRLIDKYRYFTTMSSSKMWYREMALNNIAFCYGQIGDGANAKKYYLKTLEEFPGNPLATAALALMKAAENNNQSQGENSK